MLTTINTVRITFESLAASVASVGGCVGDKEGLVVGIGEGAVDGPRVREGASVGAVGLGASVVGATLVGTCVEGASVGLFVVGVAVVGARVPFVCKISIPPAT